jgi:hypothetical protein
VASPLRRLSLAALFGAIFLTGCGSSGPASTEAGALDNLRSVLVTYNAATPRDVASTGSECARAFSGLQNSSLLAVNPTSGKELVVRRDLHAAYVQARRGFSDCAAGAKSMSYATMARADRELLDANGSLRQARAAGR